MGVNEAVVVREKGWVNYFFLGLLVLFLFEIVCYGRNVKFNVISVNIGVAIHRKRVDVPLVKKKLVDVGVLPTSFGSYFV